MTHALTQAMQERFPQHVIGAHQFRGQETVLIKREGLLDAARFLKEDPETAFDFLMDLSCVDYLKFGKALTSAPTLATPSPLPYSMTSKAMAETWARLVPEEEYRFDVVYHCYSSARRHRLRLKVPVALSDPWVDSLAGVWASADWFEREVWDMFGIVFKGHPNLKRLLMYDAFKGHPLRKDYPVRKRQPLIGPVN